MAFGAIERNEDGELRLLVGRLKPADGGELVGEVTAKENIPDTNLEEGMPLRLRPDEDYFVLLIDGIPVARLKKMRSKGNPEKGKKPVDYLSGEGWREPVFGDDREREYDGIKFLGFKLKPGGKWHGEGWAVVLNAVWNDGEGVAGGAQSYDGGPAPF